MPFGLADASNEATALSVLFSFHYFVRFHATHFIASPRSPGIGRLLETVKHLTVIPCPLGLGLRSLTVYFKEEFEAFMFVFLQLSASSLGSLRRSLRCTPAYWLDFLSCLSTDASLFQCAPNPSRGKGKMAMVAPLLPSFVRHSLCSRADLTALVEFPLFLCFCCHSMCPQGWQFERSSTMLGDRKEKPHRMG